MALIERRRLKEGGTYFKVRGVVPVKFQNFAILFFQITKNNNHYDISFLMFQNVFYISTLT